MQPFLACFILWKVSGSLGNLDHQGPYVSRYDSAVARKRRAAKGRMPKLKHPFSCTLYIHVPWKLA